MLLADLKIPFVSNCSILKDLSVAKAAQLAILPTGGSLLAINNCWVENYDPSVACSGILEEKIYTCYNNSKTKDFPLQRMWKYLDSVEHMSGSGTHFLR